MKQFEFHATASRVAQAKLAHSFTPNLMSLLQFVWVAAVVTGLVITMLGVRGGLVLLGVGLMTGCYVTWLRHGLLDIARTPLADSVELADILPAEIVDGYRPNLTGQQLFLLAANTWDGRFILERYEFSANDCLPAVQDWQLIHQDLWLATAEIAEKTQLAFMTNAMIIAACFSINPALKDLLTQRKLTLDDLCAGINWAARLGVYTKAKRPSYGGIARDWAAGFTPLLSQFGTSLSQQVEFAGKFFQLEERTSQLDTLVTELNGANGSVVLVGEPGIGKTALLLGLADRILQGVESGRLAHHQIFTLNASSIIAEAGTVGSVEQIVMALCNEAIHARNIVLALDEAQLFFGQGTGAVNLSQVLLPYLQSRSLTLVLAVTPGDWQRLKATNAGLTSLLTPLILSEPDQATTLATLADRSLLMETPANVTITYSALVAAYRLAERYIQEEAYPGRALKILEASLNHAQNGFVTAAAVEAAVEAQFGVKVGATTAAES
ncbi:MAG TPA: AAA family ATPase, partial [Candidatus Saccharimonadia bacterium]